MDADMIRRCEQLSENRKRVERVYRLSPPQMHCLCALLLCLDDHDADLIGLRRGNKLLHKNTGLFSAFRGMAMAPIATKLSVTPHAEYWLNYAKDNYRSLKTAGFAATDYLTIAALLMAKQHERRDAIAAAARTHFLEMRHAHRALTGGTDASFAVLMAMYGVDGTEAQSKGALVFDRLAVRFGRTNNVQTAAHICAMSPMDAASFAQNTEALYDAIREAGICNKGTLEVGILAYLTLLDAPIAQTAQRIVAVNEALKATSGFSKARIGRNQRLLFSACLVAIDALAKTSGSPTFERDRDLLQCTMISTVLRAIVQGMAASPN